MWEVRRVANPPRIFFPACYRRQTAHSRRGKDVCGEGCTCPTPVCICPIKKRNVVARVPDSIEQEPPIAAAGGVVYRWSAAGQLEILLIKKRDGFWTLPKGRIEPGEDERTAVAREVAEETSVTGEVGAIVRQVFYTIQKAGRRRRKTVSYYLVRATAGRPRPQARERIMRVRWFAIGVALRRIRRRRLRNVVRAARAMLTAGSALEANDTT
jgi:8-oxo-dGTP diphosphatase